MNKKTPGSTLTGLGVKWIDVHHDDEKELGMRLGKCDKSLKPSPGALGKLPEETPLKRLEQHNKNKAK